MYGRIDLKTGSLCNMTCGGEGTGELSEELESIRREKISATLTGTKASDASKIKNCFSQKKRIPVVINGVEYPSLRKAEIALGVYKKKKKKLYYIK